MKNYAILLEENSSSKPQICSIEQIISNTCNIGVVVVCKCGFEHPIMKGYVKWNCSVNPEDVKYLQDNDKTAEEVIVEIL